MAVYRYRILVLPRRMSLRIITNLRECPTSSRAIIELGKLTVLFLTPLRFCSIMQGYSITYDINHNRNMLRLVRFDGAYLPRLYLYYQPPNMLPVQQLWTSEAYKSYEESQGRGSAGGRVADISGLGIMVAAGAALLGWSLVA